MLRDPLTAAYLAIGADSAIPKGRDNYDLCERFGGHLGVISEVVKMADELDRISTHFPDDFWGTWAYEVAEPAGKLAVERLAAGETLDPYQILREIMRPPDGVHVVRLADGSVTFGLYDDGRWSWDGERLDVMEWTHQIDGDDPSNGRVAPDKRDADGFYSDSHGFWRTVLPEECPKGYPKPEVDSKGDPLCTRCGRELHLLQTVVFAVEADPNSEGFTLGECLEERTRTSVECARCETTFGVPVNH